MKKESINVQMYYQILVLGGEMIDVFPTKKRTQGDADSHIHYVQSHVTKGKENRYHIDVVTEKYFPSLLRQIASEAETTVRRLRSHQEEVQAAIDRIAASVRPPAS
jgi:hypothetical protein